MTAAAACCADLHEFSRPGRAYQPVPGLLHFLVHGALNSKKIVYRRGEFRARYVGVNLQKSRGLRIQEFGLSFTVQPESYKLFSSRTRSSDGVGNVNIAVRRFLEPLAAVATGPGDWEARLEDSQESPAEFSGTWDFKPKSLGERLAFLGILVLTGLVVVRVMRGSSLVSVGALMVLLFFCGFHHRLNPGLIFLSEKLLQLRRTFISRAHLMSIGFQEQKSGLAPDSLLYNLSGSSHLLGAEVSSAADGTSERGKLVDVKEVATCVNLLTSIIQNLDTKVIAEDVLSVNNLMNLQLGITKLREDLYRAASALQVQESLLQAKLQSISGYESQPIEENMSDATAVQVLPGNKVVNNFEHTSFHSDPTKILSSSNWSVSGRLDMKLNGESGQVVNSDSSGFTDSQQGPQSSSNYVAASGENVQAQSYEVITADYKLEPVTRFIRVAFKTRAISDSLLTEVAALEGDDDGDRLNVATEGLHNPSYFPEQIISEQLAGLDTPLMVKQSDRSHVDGIETKIVFQQEGQASTEEKELFSSLEPRSVNRIVDQEPTLIYTRNREDEQRVIVIERDSTDPWRDDDDLASSSPVMYENEDFQRKTLVMQNTITPSPSGRRRDYDNDSAPSIRSVKKGVVYSDGIKWRNNAKPGMDFRGIETTTAARAERGTVSGIKVTRRGSLDDVDNKRPEKRNSGWTDEQISRGKVRSRDLDEGDGQPTTSGQQNVHDEPELWDNESVIDEAISNRRSTRGLHIYQGRERDLDIRKVSAGDRESSYGGRNPQNRNIIGEDRSPDSRHCSHERTRSFNAEGHTQILNEEEEEEEERFSKREARDIEEEYRNESRTLFQDDVGSSQNGRDLEGNYNSQVRMKSRSRVRNNSLNRIPRVAENYVDDVKEDGRYGREATNFGEDGQEYGSGRRSRAKSQYPGKELLRVSDYHSEPERSTDLPPYVLSGIEPEERNLPVRQPNRLQLEKFDKLLDEGEALLDEGMHGLEGRIEVGVAERMLYEAANLFEAASKIDPPSLIAVGFWGNTLLVHGELKLKLSQQLRSMIPSPDSYFMTRARAGTGKDDQRESLELALQSVSEECEELLIDAGRKYRMALSMDRTDMRALYNWGLALCYRAQLIAEEGGERAIQDADKVYIAAIDKFQAILGMNQEYAVGALYNWGLAMRDRARLRPIGERDRMRLLLQAKELFQDSVRLDPTNGQARGAITAAVAELKELKRFEEMQNEQGIDRRSPRSWWE